MTGGELTERLDGSSGAWVAVDAPIARVGLDPATGPFVAPERMQRRETAFRRLLAAADAISISVTFGVCFGVVGATALEPVALVVPALFVLCAKAIGLYDRDAQLLHKSTLDEVPRLFALSTLAVLLLDLCESALVEGVAGPGQVALAWLALFGLLIALRPLARYVGRELAPPERCLFVGDATSAEEFRENLASSPAVKAELSGWIPVEPVGDAPRDAAPALAGRIRTLIAERDIERVVIGPDPANNDRLLDSIRELRGHGVRVSVLPDVSRVVSSAIELDRVNGLTLLGVRRFEITHSSKLIKRSFDLFGSTLALALAAPVLLAIAIAIRLEGKGPITFRQQRAGRHGEPFEMIKFRSMVVGAEKMQLDLLHLNEADGVFKMTADPRVTRVGRVIRRLHLDELPQLVNVVRGDMSLVGPRPLPLAEDRRIEGWHRRRLDLRPGITGPWQVLGSAKLPVREMVRLDYQYVADWSLWNDIRILLLTLGHMARARGV
jgi:exopolysaccharide biosynthesis polyprenyl glycosylphosphotransferase